MEEVKIQNEHNLYPPMIAGVAVTYAKNFNQAEGLGPLPRSFTRFPKSEMHIAHVRLIEARNTLYAHRDISAHSFKMNDGRVTKYPVEVRINNENTAFLFQPQLIDIPPRRISSIRKLIEFQMTRLQQDLDNKLSIIVDFNKGYKQGIVYLLGEDFP